MGLVVRSGVDVAGHVLDLSAVCNRGSEAAGAVPKSRIAVSELAFSRLKGAFLWVVLSDQGLMLQCLCLT
jgi:hypothetical protein